MMGIKNAMRGIYMMLAAMLVSVKGRPTRRFLSGMTTLTLAAVVLLVAAGTVSALTACPAPGNTEISTSCELTQDYTVTTAGQYGYKITADNVVIDGKGYTLTGTMSAGEICNGGEDDPCTCTGIANDGYNNVVVKDLEIKGFCTGVSIGRSSHTPTNMSVIGCKIHDCGKPGDYTVSQGIHLAGADNITISNNTIYNIDGERFGGCGAGGNGIFVYGRGEDTGNHNIITHNDIFDNTKSGLFTKQMSMYNYIAYNNITGPGNYEGGITLMCMHSSYNLIEWNNVSGNDGGGINLGGYYNNVSNNTIEDNTHIGVKMSRCKYCDSYGRNCTGSYNNTLFNNSICRNGGKYAGWGYGVYVLDYCSSNPLDTKLYNNTMCDNVDWDLHNGGPNGCDPNTTGDWNTGDTVCGRPYYDIHHAPGHNFTWHCPGSGPDLMIRNLNPHWVNSYNVSFEVYNRGAENAAASDTSVKIVDRNDGTVHEVTYPIPALDGGTGHQIEIGPFNINDDEPHTITVCADIDNDVDEYGFGDEANNCSTDVFGAPDLIVPGYTWDWVDASKKLVNITYTVNNIGDANITAGQSFSVCALAVTGGSWGPCCEVVQGPLNVGGSYIGTIGPITVDTGNEKVRVYADYYDVIIENNEECDPAACGYDNCEYRTLSYPGPCLDGGCGDVDCNGGLPDAGDYQILRDYVGGIPGVSLNCIWAGDVDSSDCNGGLPAAGDYQILRDYVGGIPGVSLNCCKGGC